ncbi:MAG: hypothetical protein PHQ00_06240 [Phycisphaerae bacterium]|jgi:hypothetical protein|nr:hypothetical protein [Phycisphaerae bacterium]
MADIIWLGGTTDHETDANTAANWDLARIPADGDRLIFNGAAVTNSATGLKYNCDFTLLSGTLSLTGIIKDSGFTGNIGSAANPLICNIEYDGTKGEFNFKGAGYAYVELTTESTYKACERVNIIGGGVVYLYSDSASDNDWGNVYISGGTLYLADSTILNSLTVDGSSTQVIGGKGCQKIGATAVDIDISGGTVKWDSNISDSFRQTGGVFYWGTADYQSGYGAVDITADFVDIRNTGTVFYWNMVADSGQVSGIKRFRVINGGKLDASQPEGLAGAKQIGTAGGGQVSEVWTNSTANLNSSAMSMAGGSPAPSIKCYGGNLVLPDNNEVTF